MRRDYKPSITDILTRGVHEVIDASHLEARLREGKPLRIKLGIDPTSLNIHLGRAVQLLKLRDFQLLGHHIVLIIGDFTGVIGDTSDKTAERPMLAQETIEENLKTYVEQAGKILDMDSVEVVHNADWLGKLAYREIVEQANEFSLAEFTARTNIKDRLNAGKRISLRELLYPLMQGYDSVVVKADVELGGSDQRFNLLAGRVLQKYYGQEPQDILTSNLIMGLDGRKMSSSWGNTINLLDEAEDMYGKVMSMADQGVIEYFVHCTRVSMEEIAEHERQLSAGTNPRDIKMKLAREITSMYWGEERAGEAEEHFKSVFQKKEVPEDIQVLSAKPDELIVDLLVRLSLAPSKAEARRLIIQGGVTLDGKKITDPQAQLEKSGVLRVGKIRMLKIEVE